MFRINLKSILGVLIGCTCFKSPGDIRLFKVLLVMQKPHEGMSATEQASVPVSNSEFYNAGGPVHATAS